MDQVISVTLNKLANKDIERLALAGILKLVVISDPRHTECSNLAEAR